MDTKRSPFFPAREQKVLLKNECRENEGSGGNGGKLIPKVGSHSSGQYRHQLWDAGDLRASEVRGDWGQKMESRAVETGRTEKPSEGRNQTVTQRVTNRGSHTECHNTEGHMEGHKKGVIFRTRHKTYVCLYLNIGKCFSYSET